ncbi:N5-carboxyaminoimidazole ribonucleotide synthase [Burkholderiales bacterium]|nr:N5-carboxyaminoimidazole ribonucleotide synthase [Burkholderiales bacterium]
MTDHDAEGAIAPGSWLGVLGGGQLGRMFCMAAQSMGYRVCVLDPAADGPAGAVAERQIVAAYDDSAALEELGRCCAAVTTEFENVPARSLELLARYCPVRPSAAAVTVAQDRIAEKGFVRSCGVEVVPHAALTAATDPQSLDAALFPAILKTARLGYDGKGQVDVDERAALGAAWAQLQSVECVLERRLALRRELSVIVARGSDGAKAYFPVSENEHRDGILACSVVPARIDTVQTERACAIAARIADGLAYVGVLCVELFELADGQLLVNEIAPRPHNSGHATIEACVSSQFEQQVRALARMPLGDSRLLTPAVMLNLLGDLWVGRDGQVCSPAFDRVLAVPGACLHLYGKSEARRGRKMGHVTVVGESMGLACQRAASVANILHLELPRSVAQAAMQ